MKDSNHFSLSIVSHCGYTQCFKPSLYATLSVEHLVPYLDVQIFIN